MRTRMSSMMVATAMLLIFIAACGGGEQTTQPDQSPTEGTQESPGKSPENTIRAHSDEETVGLSDDEIKIGVLTPLTGPVAAANGITEIASKMVIDATNASGGVHGRQIVTVTADEGESPSASAASLRRLIEDDQVFAILGCVWGPGSVGHRDIIENARIPAYYESCGFEGLYDPPSPWIFTTTVTNTMEGHAAYEAATRLHEPSTIVVLAEESIYGEIAADAVEKLASDDDIAVEVLPIAPDATSATTQVAQIQEDEPDVVIVATLFQAGTVFLKEFCTREVDVPLVNTLGTSASNVLEAVPADCKANYITGTTNNKDIVGGGGLAEVADQFENIADRKPFDWELLGVGGAETFIHGLEMAGEDLTRTGLRNALESISEFETSVFAGPVTFGPDKHIGNYTFRAFQFDDEGASILIDEPIDGSPVDVGTSDS